MAIQDLSIDEIEMVDGGALTRAQEWEIAILVGVVILAVALA